MQWISPRTESPTKVLTSARKIVWSRGNRTEGERYFNTEIFSLAAKCCVSCGLVVALKHEFITAKSTANGLQY